LPSLVIALSSCSRRVPARPWDRARGYPFSSYRTRQARTCTGWAQAVWPTLDVVISDP